MAVGGVSLNSSLDLQPPDDLELPERVRWCWQRWCEGNTLIVVDDVTNYSKITPYLPTQSSQFKVLITTRLKLNLAVSLDLQVLSESDALKLLTELVGLYCNQGRYEEAEPLYIQALELRKPLLGENHPDYADNLNNLAILYCNQGRYEEAELLCKQTLELRKRLLGENHPDYALSSNNLANIYREQGKYEEAEPLYIQALELRKPLLGENHPDYADNLNNLAILYKDQGKYDQAEPLYRQALEIAERVFGSDHPDTVKYRRNLENLRAQQQQTSGDD